MKEIILQKLIHQANAELSALKDSLEASVEFATDKEFKQESKYELSFRGFYLAGAHAKRIEELKLDIQLLEEVDLNACLRLQEITSGALVNLLHHNQSRCYFLIPTSGGTMLEVEGQAILVVSLFSPLGDAMLGLKMGDEFEVETPKENRQYKIISFT